MIDAYLASDRKFGYNIALGGKGRSVVSVSETVRQKISSSQSQEQIGIKKVIDENGNCIGYRARRREKGKCYSKQFTKSSLSLDEKLQMAENFIENIKNNRLPSKSLHMGICEIDNGFSAYINIDNKRYSKSFCSNRYSSEQKFEFALEWRKNIEQHNFSYKSPYDIESVIDMKNVSVTKNKKGIETGYCCKIIKNKIIYKKSFQSSSMTMDKKYNLAITWRNNLIQILRNNDQNDLN